MRRSWVMTLGGGVASLMVLLYLYVKPPQPSNKLDGFAHQVLASINMDTSKTFLDNRLKLNGTSVETDLTKGTSWTFNSSLPAPKELLPSQKGLCGGVPEGLPIWTFQRTCGCTMLQQPSGFQFSCGNHIDFDENTPLIEARDKYYKHMLRLHARCGSHELLGKAGDGGWIICKEGPFHLTHSKCLIYSIGIRNDWSFDDAISKKYNCDVRSWDPSIGKPDHKHAPKVWFYDTGLGGRNEEAADNSKGWRMRTLGTMFKELGHDNSTIDFVKFDVEFSEWSALEAMISEGSLLRVKQLAMELHTWRDNTRDYLYFTKLLQSLENLGFQRWHHLNLNWRCFHEKRKRYCPQCNMHFINVNFLKPI